MPSFEPDERGQLALKVDLLNQAIVYAKRNRIPGWEALVHQREEFKRQYAKLPSPPPKAEAAPGTVQVFLQPATPGVQVAPIENSRPLTEEECRELLQGGHLG